MCCWALLAASAAEREAEWSVVPLEVAESFSVGFRQVPSTESGVSFVNFLAEESAGKNRILENGSGIAAGDIDGDGWVDLYFCRLEGDNALYRNLGGWRFEEVSSAAGVACPDQASTGAALADIDGDGDLDLLVTGIGVGARCFLNDSTGIFIESTESGLDRESGSMSMALADADQDGDLDLYVANYRTVTWKDFPPGVSARVNRVGGKPFATPSDRFVAALRPDGSTNVIEIGQPDHFYLNDGSGRFRAVDWKGGQFLDEEGKPLSAIPRHWGLSVAFRDFNGDGLPDLYVCNDFLIGNDDFYLNQGGGIFRRIDQTAIRHSSWSSMAVDVADINRDGNMDFIVADMLSRDLTRRLTQRANQETGIRLREPGVIRDRPQQQHNTLFLNRGDGSYAEIAHLAGLEATEWTWSLMFLDVDLDGYDDLLVGNGHAHDLLDGDATITATLAMRSAPRGQQPQTLLMYPRLDLADLAMRNGGDLRFSDASDDWGFNAMGVTSALCRADLDNDGDWDVVANRLQDQAILYENVGSESRIKVAVKSGSGNRFGIGTVVELVPMGEARLPKQRQEIVSGGRYLSSEPAELVFATGDPAHRFQLNIHWSGGGESQLENIIPNHAYLITEPEAKHESASLAQAKVETETWFEDQSDALLGRHETQLFNDLERQRLMPRLLSQMDPGLLWADLNQDGFEDLVVAGGGKGNAMLYLNRKGETFQPWDQVLLERSLTSGLWLNTKGNEYQYVGVGSSYRRGLRSDPAVEVFSFDGKQFSEEAILPGQLATVGPLTALDYDRDGDLDLFVGGRVNPGRYPAPAISRLYENIRGEYRLDLERSRSFVDVGLVRGTVASDFDGDGDTDLALALEWGSLRLWLNTGEHFKDVSEQFGLSQYRGWWSGIASGDFNEDGRMDLVASNWGSNSKYERYREQAIRIAYGDLDGNGTVENVELVWDGNRERWSALRDLIVMGEAVPSLQQRTRSYREFAEKGIQWALGGALESLDVLEVDWLESTVFLNRGERFEATQLPVEAQFAPGFGLVVADFDGDRHEDLFLAQNYFATQPETPRMDAGLGLLLRGRGDGSFHSVAPAESGIRVFGEQRGAAVADYDDDGRMDLAVAQNGSRTRLFLNQKGEPSHRLKLQGPPGNRQAIGTKLRLKQNGEWVGPMREIQAGSGYWSQNSTMTLWPTSDSEQELVIIWPSGKRSSLALKGEAREWLVRFSKTEDE